MLVDLLTLTHLCSHRGFDFQNAVLLNSCSSFFNNILVPGPIPLWTHGFLLVHDCLYLLQYTSLRKLTQVLLIEIRG